MNAAQLEALRRLPKAELHLHLEGSVAPATLLELSRRHGYPCGFHDLATCESLSHFNDFPGFLQSIKLVAEHLRAPADYALITTRLAEQLAAQGIVYAEVFLSVGILLIRKLPVEEVWQAAEAARLEAEKRLGVRLAWIFDAVRQFGPAHVARVVDEAIARAGFASLVGVGIGGDERAGPAMWFVESFRRARAAGLQLTAHAGEFCGPESVWSTLEGLAPQRIGHGLRAIEDPALVEALRTRAVWLDICPVSNVRTGALARLDDHPLPQYLRAGVPCTLNSDDPALFETTLLGEYQIAHQRLGLTFDELLELVRNGFRGSFLPVAEKQHWLARIDSELAAGEFVAIR